MNTAQNESNDRRLRRVAHPWRLIGMATVILLLLAGSFLAGRLARPPAHSAPSTASEILDVWAPVERRTVAQTTSFAGITRPGGTRPVVVSTQQPAVVLKQLTQPGQRVRPGDAAGVVSGRTFIFLPEPLALYRDLVAGDRGDDVKALQQALTAAGQPTTADGTLGPGTIRSVRGLFRAAGSPLPADQPVTVPYEQFIPLPAEGAVVSSSAAYGSRLSGDDPLVTLQTSLPSVEFTADITLVEDLARGQQVSITSEAGSIDGEIVKIGDFRAGTEGGRSGHPVTVTFDVSAAAAPPVGQSVTVVPASDDPADAVLAVPQTALRAEGSQTYVLVQSPPRSQGPSPDVDERRVNVTVTRTGGGYAAITGEVRPGERVKVS